MLLLWINIERNLDKHAFLELFERLHSQFEFVLQHLSVCLLKKDTDLLLGDGGDFFFPETQSRNLRRIGFHFSGIREVIVSFMQKIRFHFCGVSWVRIRNWNEMGEIKCKFWIVLASSLAGKLANTQKMIVLMLEVMRGWFINNHCTKWVLSFSKAIWGIGEEIR